MAAFTDNAENKLIDFIFRAQALGLAGASAAAGTGPANLFVALFTGAPTETGTGTEVTGGGYARVPVVSSLTAWAGTQAALSVTASTGTNGTTSNNNTLTFPAPSATWGLVIGYAVYDSLTGGTSIFYGNLQSSRQVNSGDPASTFPPSSLTFQIDN